MKGKGTLFMVGRTRSRVSGVESKRKGVWESLFTVSLPRHHMASRDPGLPPVPVRRSIRREIFVVSSRTPLRDPHYNGMAEASRFLSLASSARSESSSNRMKTPKASSAAQMARPT